MIFSPMLARKVVTGKKTVTRRRLTHRGGRPIRYKPNHPYAVQPGRLRFVGANGPAPFPSAVVVWSR